MTDYDVETFFFILKSLFRAAVSVVVMVGSVILFMRYVPIPVDIKACLLILWFLFFGKSKKYGDCSAAIKQLEDTRKRKKQNEQLYQELLKKQKIKTN